MTNVSGRASMVIAALAAVALAAVAFAVITMTSRPAEIRVAPAAATAPAHRAAATAPAHASTPAPARTIYVTPPAQDPPASAPASAPATAPAPAQPKLTNPQAVVLQYYQDVTDQDWPAAWAIGGDNIAAQNGQTYDSWVTGYTSTTASISVTSYGTWSDGTVWTDLSATQLDGSVNTYSGAYTVSDGVIVSASITQT